MIYDVYIHIYIYVCVCATYMVYILVYRFVYNITLYVFLVQAPKNQKVMLLSCKHQAFEPFPTTKQNSHGSHRPAAMRHVDTQERRSRIDRGREEVPGTPHQALRGEVPCMMWSCGLHGDLLLSNENTLTCQTIKYYQTDACFS